MSLPHCPQSVHVRQSNIQLTCYSYRRNCDKTRLRCCIVSHEHFEDSSVTYADTQENPPDSTDPEYKTHNEPTLISMGDVRSAIFQHIVDTAVSCSFLVPAVNYSQDVNLTTV